MYIPSIALSDKMSAFSLLITHSVSSSSVSIWFKTKSMTIGAADLGVNNAKWVLSSTSTSCFKKNIKIKNFLHTAYKEGIYSYMYIVRKYKHLFVWAVETGKNVNLLWAFLACFSANANTILLKPTMYIYYFYPTMS